MNVTQYKLKKDAIICDGLIFKSESIYIENHGDFNLNRYEREIKKIRVFRPNAKKLGVISINFFVDLLNKCLEKVEN
jgi:hypothetical protein